MIRILITKSTKIRDHTETAVIQRTDLAVTRVLTIPKTDIGVTEEVILGQKEQIVFKRETRSKEEIHRNYCD